MERFVIIINGWKPLTIITKPSILDVAAALDTPLKIDWLFDSVNFLLVDKVKNIFGAVVAEHEKLTAVLR